MNHLLISHRRAKGRSRRAFTLLELIVVIVILGIIAALALPTFTGVITKSKVAVLTSNADAVLKQAEAEAELGISAAGPVNESLVSAADQYWLKGTSGATPSFVPPSSGVTVWAQNGNSTSSGVVEAYNSSWNLCVALQVPSTYQYGSPPPGASTCQTPSVSGSTTTSSGALTLMAVETTTSASPSAPVEVAAVAPYVPSATSYSFVSASGTVQPSSTPYETVSSGSDAPSSVVLSGIPSGPVTISSGTSTASTGTSTVSVTATSTQVKLSWTLSSGVTPTGSFSVYRCDTPGCTPIASGKAYASAASTATSYTDTAVTTGTPYSYQIVVPTTTGPIVSNIATATPPVEPLLSVFAGTGTPGAPTPGPATSSGLGAPDSAAVDPTTGDVYIADFANNVVEKVTPSGTLSIVAGTGTAGAPTPGPATSSDLNGPASVAVNPSTGDLYIADMFNYRVEKVTPSGTLSIVAGTGTPGAPTPGPATSSDLGGPAGVAVNPSTGDLYISDNGDKEVEKVTPSGTLSIVAGTGAYGAPVPGPATSSPLGNPFGIAVNTSTGDLYITDPYHNAVEKVTPSGTLSIVAGGNASGAPMTGPATSAYVAAPYGVAVSPSTGDLYIAENGSSVVAQVTPSGTLSIVAGVVNSAGAPTPGPATSSDLDGPIGVAVNPSTGDLYIADSTNYLVEKVTNP